MSSQNKRYWASKDPRYSHVVLLRDLKVRILENNKQSNLDGTIGFERFFLLILTPIFYHLEEDSERYCHVMQDGATTHTSNNSTNALAEVFYE